MLTLMASPLKSAPPSGHKPRLVDRIIACMGSSRKLSTALHVGEDYPTRWRHEGFITARWAFAIGEFQLSDEWGHITALDVVQGDADGRAARKARREVEAAARLAALEAHLASLAAAEGEGADPAG